MDFKDFIHNLSSVLRAGESTDKFTHTIFDAIVTEKGRPILDEYSNSSYKAFFNGNTSIRKISQKINIYIDSTEFYYFINQYDKSVLENLSKVFKDYIPDVNKSNVAKKLADIFVEIITDAAEAKNKPTQTPSPSSNIKSEEGSITESFSYKINVPKEFFNEFLSHESDNPFIRYLNKAKSYYSTKKTLLYAEKPHPFYELYVCNDIKYHKYLNSGSNNTKVEVTISDANIQRLENESHYIIIEGTGGIGKSMFLTHLFLSSVQNFDRIEKIPLLLTLKNYIDTTENIIDFIWKSICDYDSEFPKIAINEALQRKKLVLLLDGYDEIQSSVRETFQSDLEAFIKTYNGNTVIMTSRPIYSTFISFSKFSVFHIEPLTKAQALTLVEKLEFWDNTAKNNFIKDLDNKLYFSHTQFASNPLLLTIMLMTYSTFGEIPAKMHVFYSKAYETMARLHDASKGSFKRPLYTKLTPEVLSRYFAEFCARTYMKETLEFDERSFTSYMNNVLSSNTLENLDVTPHNFLLDLTDNLCIMYREGSNYYFIHRSFQEYFAAVYFSSLYDSDLHKVGDFFNSKERRNYADKTFEMMYDMIPSKVERFIFLPYLEDLLNSYTKKGNDEYWEFLEDQYPYITYIDGDTEDNSTLLPRAFLYSTITDLKNINYAIFVESVQWPNQVQDLEAQAWISVYSSFADDEGFLNCPDLNDSVSILDEISIIPIEDLPEQYESYFGTPEITGLSIEISISDLRNHPDEYREIREFMKAPDFPLMLEYRAVKDYYKWLKDKTEKEKSSICLFSD